MKFRQHRGGLSDSMKTQVELLDRAALLLYIQSILKPWGRVVLDSTLHVQHYGYDDRIDWDNYIVTVDDWGVIGYTDGPA